MSALDAYMNTSTHPFMYFVQNLFNYLLCCLQKQPTPPWNQHLWLEYKTVLRSAAGNWQDDYSYIKGISTDFHCCIAPNYKNKQVFHSLILHSCLIEALRNEVFWSIRISSGYLTMDNIWKRALSAVAVCTVHNGMASGKRGEIHGH